MGWFLTKKKKSAPKARPKSNAALKPDAPGAWDPARTLMQIRLFVGAVAIAALAIGWYYGEQALTRYAAKLTDHAPLAPDKVQLINTPPWMSLKLQTQIRELAATGVTNDPLDRDELDKAANSVRSSPWVSQVNRVQRVSDGSIRIWANFHTPVAVIAGDDQCRMIDATGILLPGVYDKGQGYHLGLPLITRVANPAPAEGTRWQGDDIKAALSLIQYLHAQPYFPQIRAFDVGDRDAMGRLRLALLTRRGMVRWGLPLGEEQPIEPDPATKRNSLALMQKQSGTIDDGGKIVDIYGATINVSLPANDDSTASASYTVAK